MGCVSLSERFFRDGVPLLGRIPLDPDLTNQQQEFDGIAEQLVDVLEHPAAA